jgi:hypothetical protein
MSRKNLATLPVFPQNLRVETLHPGEPCESASNLSTPIRSRIGLIVALREADECEHYFEHAEYVQTCAGRALSLASCHLSDGL